MIDNYLEELKETLSNIDKESITRLAEKIKQTGEAGKTIFIIGNGGSAVNASHWACDLGKGTLKRYYNDSQKRFKVVSLADNIATITALANDITYDEIFAQQLRNLVSPGDLLITMTGSGNSRNVLNAIELAKKSGVHVFSLLGFDGGEAAHLSDDSIIIPSNNYGIIEDIHLTIGHLVTETIKNESNLVKG